MTTEFQDRIRKIAAPAASHAKRAQDTQQETQKREARARENIKTAMASFASTLQLEGIDISPQSTAALAGSVRKLIWDIGPILDVLPKGARIIFQFDNDTQGTLLAEAQTSPPGDRVSSFSAESYATVEAVEQDLIIVAGHLFRGTPK